MTAARLALVTGEGQAIGRTIALRQAQKGLDVIVLDVNGQAISYVVAEIKAIG